jgi:hypothetical protein
MNLEEEVLNLVDQLKAADAADLFLSPYVRRDVLHLLTRNEGPALWMVNRSDVPSETLELLSNHPDLRIAQRSKEKLNLRERPPQGLPAPIALHSEEDISKIMDADVEEILGHPQVSVLAILRLSYSIKDEHRASAALSLSRRLLEYPPKWKEERVTQQEVESRFAAMLLNDSSAYARSYCTRLPFLDSSLLDQALACETHPLVRARLLQHPKLEASILMKHAQKTLHSEDDPLVECVLALDSRLSKEFREELLHKRGSDLPQLAELVHRIYLSD